MKKLLQGIVEFHNNLSNEYRTLFAKLALGQKPDSLFIACSDSRVVPNLFASTNPGDLFVLRNIGNLIPPKTMSLEDNSTLAALEFSVLELNVNNIIVCGHSECGATKLLLEKEKDVQFTHLNTWLKYGKDAATKINDGQSLNPALSKHDQVSQMNVLLQMEHIASHPFVRERMNRGSLRIHGWWFDIAQADVYCYEPDLEKFVLIDEKEAELILSKLG